MYKELLFLFIIVWLLLIIFRLKYEKHLLEKQIRHMELMNEKTFGLPWNPNETKFVKRIGSIYTNGDLDKQELEINFIVDSDYEKFVKRCSNVNVISENIALINNADANNSIQSQNE